MNGRFDKKRGFIPLLTEDDMDEKDGDINAVAFHISPVDT